MNFVHTEYEVGEYDIYFSVLITLVEENNYDSEDCLNYLAARNPSPDLGSYDTNEELREDLMSRLLLPLMEMKVAYDMPEPSIYGTEGWTTIETPFHKLKERALFNKEKSLSFYVDGRDGSFLFSLAVWVDAQKAGIVDSDYYDFDPWTELGDPIIYTVVDVSSIVLAFVGLDWIPELAGLTYSTFRGHAFESSLYAMGLIIINVPAEAVPATSKLVYTVSKNVDVVTHSNIIVKKVGDLSPDDLIISTRIPTNDVAGAISKLNAEKHQFDISQVQKLVDDVVEGGLSWFTYLNGKNIVVPAESKAAFLNMFDEIADGVLVETKTIEKLDFGSGTLKNFDQEIKVLPDGSKCTFEDGFCFVAGTPINLGNNEFIPIENLEIGDSVLTYNHQTGQPVKNKITNTFKRIGRSFTQLLLGGVTVVGTSNHPIYANGIYTEMAEVAVGDSVLSESGNWLLVEQKINFNSKRTVYNLELEYNHNYYVSESSILVHNKCSFQEIQDKLLADFPALFNRIINAEIGPALRGHIYRKLAGLSDEQILRFSDNFADNPSALKKLDDLVNGDDVSKLNQFIDDFVDDADGLISHKNDITLIDDWLLNFDNNLHLTPALKAKLNQAGVSIKLSDYVLAPGSTGGAYVLRGVPTLPKEVALADEIFDLTGKKCIFPVDNMPGIEGFLDDGVAFSMKELESNLKNLTRNLNIMYDKAKLHGYSNVMGYLKIPFDDVLTPKGTKLVTEAWIMERINSTIRLDGFKIKNDGTLDSIEIFLNDGTSFFIDLTLFP